MWKQLHILILTCLIASCGGGTFGTGGSDGSDVQATVRFQSGAAIVGAQVEVAGQAETAVTDDNGGFVLKLNRQVASTLINFEIEDLGSRSIYVDTAKALASPGGVEFVIEEDGSEVEAEAGDRGSVEEVDCQSILAFWRGVTQDTSLAVDVGITAGEVKRIERVLDNQALTCEEKLDRIDEIFFVEPDRPDDARCREDLDAWLEIIRDDTQLDDIGVSQADRKELRRIADDESLSCRDKVDNIEAIFFMNPPSVGGDDDLECEQVLERRRELFQDQSYLDGNNIGPKKANKIRAILDDTNLSCEDRLDRTDDLIFGSGDDDDIVAFDGGAEA